MLKPKFWILYNNNCLKNSFKIPLSEQFYNQLLILVNNQTLYSKHHSQRMLQYIILKIIQTENMRFYFATVHIWARVLSAVCTYNLLCSSVSHPLYFYETQFPVYFQNRNNWELDLLFVKETKVWHWSFRKAHILCFASVKTKRASALIFCWL